MENKVIYVNKRNGQQVVFEPSKIAQAIGKAIQVSGDSVDEAPITDRVIATINERFLPPSYPSVEQVQDIIEEVLIDCKYAKIAKAYIIYRHERQQLRKKRGFIAIEDNNLTHIVKRDGTVVPFDQEKINTAIYKAGSSLKIHDHALSEKLTTEVIWILNKNFSRDDMPTVEDIQDTVEEVLIKNNCSKIAKAYILYREERAKYRETKKLVKRSRKHEIIPYKKLWQILVWNVEHQCETIDNLNQHIRGDKTADLIAQADQAYQDDVAEAARQIIERKDEVRLVVIAGPSCSGKTTTTIKLSEYLQKEGLRLVALNIDNYFHNLDCQPRDKFGDYDFETPEALDLQLINQHLQELLAYKTAAIPRYDFKTGKRLSQTDPMQIKKGEIILIDTLHGLYSGMTSGIPDMWKFKLYIETLSQIKDENSEFIRWTDIRLLRRMVRDKAHRNYAPDKTLEHWHYVRRSELKHIIPYIPHVDYIVNGSLCYELPVLKKYLFSYFPDFVKKYKDSEHQDAYFRAQRVYRLLDKIATLEDESCIPGNSLMREFIGGSVYKY